MQDKELSEGFERLKVILEKATEVALNQLSNKANQVAHEEEVRALEVDHENRTWKMKKIKRLSPLLSSNFTEEIAKMTKLPEIRKCIEFMSSAGFAERLGWIEVPTIAGIPEEMKWKTSKEAFILNMIFRNFIADYIMNFGFGLRQDNFSKVFEDLRSHIVNFDGNRRSALVLRNFDMIGLESIEIFGCKVRYMQPDEILGLIETGAYNRNVGYPYDIPSTGLSGILDPVFCVSLPPLVFGDEESEKIREGVKLKIQLLLHLFKPEFVGTETEISYHLNYPRAIGTPVALLVDLFELAILPQEKYTIRDHDVSSLKKLEVKINEIDFNKWDALKLAVMRLMGVHFKRNSDDALIDLMIALEALLGPRDRSEIGFRVSLRLAYLLGHDEDHRREIYNIASLSYKIRSKIVHGGQKTASAIQKQLSTYGINNIDDLAKRLREYVRLLLLTLIDMASIYNLSESNYEKWHNKLLEEIDKNIVARAQR